MAASPVPAAAQLVEFMEWLDRLSGPGPFEHDPGWLVGAKIPLACVTEVTTTNPGVQNGADVHGFKFEGLPGCLGVVALFRSLNRDAAPWGMDGEATIREKRNVFGFELKLSHLASEENNLEYAGNLSQAQKKVKIGVYGLGIRYLPHEAAYLFTGWERYHFYSAGGLFESFNRDTTRLELGVKPLWRVNALQGALKSLTISTGIIHGLGPFVARDFGATGAFAADDERQAFITIGYDVWQHGRFTR